MRLLLEARPLPAARQVEESVCRRSISFRFCVLLRCGRSGRSAGKKQVPPLLFLERGSFSPLKAMAVTARLERQCVAGTAKLLIRLACWCGGSDLFRPKIVAKLLPKTQRAATCVPSLCSRRLVSRLGVMILAPGLCCGFRGVWVFPLGRMYGRKPGQALSRRSDQAVALRPGMAISIPSLRSTHCPPAASSPAFMA